MGKLVVATIAVALGSCAGPNAMEHAAEICVAAGYQQSDADFPVCVEDNMRLARAEALHRRLQHATFTQLPQRTYFEGMSYERDYLN